MHAHTHTHTPRSVHNKHIPPKNPTPSHIPLTTPLPLLPRTVTTSTHQVINTHSTQKMAASNICWEGSYNPPIACGPQPYQLHKHFHTAHPHNLVYTHTTDHSALQPKVYRGRQLSAGGLPSREDPASHLQVHGNLVPPRYHPEKTQPVVHKSRVIWCLHTTIQRGRPVVHKTLFWQTLTASSSLHFRNSHSEQWSNAERVPLCPPGRTQTQSLQISARKPRWKINTKELTTFQGGHIYAHTNQTSDVEGFKCTAQNPGYCWRQGFWGVPLWWCLQIRKGGEECISKNTQTHVEENETLWMYEVLGKTWSCCTMTEWCCGDNDLAPSSLL